MSEHKAKEEAGTPIEQFCERLIDNAITETGILTPTVADNLALREGLRRRFMRVLAESKFTIGGGAPAGASRMGTPEAPAAAGQALDARTQENTDPNRVCCPWCGHDHAKSEGKMIGFQLGGANTPVGIITTAGVFCNNCRRLLTMNVIGFQPNQPPPGFDPKGIIPPGLGRRGIS